MTLGTPMYFGLEGHSRFGLLHWPTGLVRGGAVVCPPLGYEDVCAHTTLRRLAEQLARRGIATLRVDYDGTGNSMGCERDGGRLRAWSDSIDDAVREFEHWGVGSLTLIGLRFGATLAVDAAGRHESIAATALWDPVRSGRRYGRALRMLAARADNHEDPPRIADQVTSEGMTDGVSVAGVWFSAETLADMDTMTLAPDAVQVPSLVVLRRGLDREANRWTGAANPMLDVRVRPGIAELIDADAELAVVPTSIVEEICDWVGARSIVPDATTSTNSPDVRTSAIEAIEPETQLRHELRRFGPAQLFGVDTACDVTSPRHCLMTLNNGVARSIGPGGAWVELARRAAVQGWRVVRLDISGIGDSPARPGAADNISYPVTAAADVGSVIGALRAEGVESFVLACLCSGALLSFDAALEHPEIEAIVSINGRFDAVFSGPRADRHHRAAGYTNPLLGTPLRKTPLLTSFEKVPFWVWEGLARTGLVASPVQALETVLDQGVRVATIFGPQEWGLRALRRRGGKRFRKIEENPMTTVVEISGLDHSMFDPRPRTEVVDFMLGYLRTCGLPASASIFIPMSA